ncbi:MAG: dihydrodipicolinate synthase family protein [Streptosporangiales bacterium]|nr:dihydrodipicolinate synthase family protein [Streptosporangiales bacterium]
MLLEGVIPANILPLDTDLEIDEAAYRKHLAWLTSIPGVRGITCNGHAAEVASLARDERRRALAIAVDTVAGSVPVVSGVYAENHRDAAVLARDAQAEGADALLIFPPNLLAYDAPPDTAYRHFAEIAEAVPLPLVAFVYPEWSGLQYDTDTLMRICEIPSVAAVKEWSLDIRVHERNCRAVRSLGRPVSLLTSFSTNLLPALAGGVDGILSGHGSVIAELQAKLFDAVAGDRLEEARRLYEPIQRLTAVIYRSPMANMYARMKEHLIMLGHQLSPAVRPPLVPVDETERRELRSALVDAGLLAENG